MEKSSAPASLNAPVSAHPVVPAAVSTSVQTQSIAAATTAARAFGGIFAPLAQFPGTRYDRILPKQDASAPYLQPTQPQGREKIVVRSQVRQSISTMKTTSLPYSSALLLVDMEGNASTEKFALREVGLVRTRVMTSGVQAAKLLSGMGRRQKQEGQENIDLVVCHPRLSDMTALQWLALIRQHPRLANLPVLMITGAQKNNDMLTALHAHKCSASLTRPYTQDDLRTILAKLHEEAPLAQKKSAAEHTQAFEALLQRFENCKSELGRAEFHFHEGLRFLQTQAWDNALHALTRAATHIDLKGDAELGIAAAWRAKEDMARYHKFLHEAAHTFARAKKWHKARTAYERLLRTLPKASSPFLQSAESFVRAQQFTDAAEALLAGRNLGPMENAAQRLAKACLSTQNPNHTVDALLKALQHPSLNDIRATLYEDMRALQKAHESAVARREKEKVRMELEAQAWEARKRASQNVMQKYGLDDEDLHSLEELQDLLDLNLDDEFDNDAADMAPTPSEKKGLRSFFSGRKTKKNAEAKELSNAPNMLDTITDTAHSDDILGDRDASAQRQSQHNQAPAIDLLTEENAEARLFAAFPGLNEVATVMKVTWKLMRNPENK